MEVIRYIVLYCYTYYTAVDIGIAGCAVKPCGCSWRRLGTSTLAFDIITDTKLPHLRHIV